ncbi:sulfite exporter TauE/SafE family protein [Caldalkalibacillus uzonensis]|nr:sulfite exporter TauE/SafE family protein [Caldalkalibacillus uzonensis]
MLLGLTAATIGSLVGLGGGVILVPVLLYLGLIGWLDVSHQVAVGTSLIVIIVTALSSTLSYLKQKRVEVQCGLLFFLASGPGAIAGAMINQRMEVDRFAIVCGLFMIFMSFMLMLRGRLKKKKEISWSVTKRYIDPRTGEEYRYGYHRGIGLIVSFLVGILTGLFGLGGGAFIISMMILLFHFPPHVATATSMFIILLSSIIGSFTHLYYGNINWWYVLALAPGAWVGGRLGPWISTKLHANWIVLILRILLIVIGIRLIWQGIVG